MWLAQTYLAGLSQAFPAYVYLFVNPYADWKQDVMRVRRLLSQLGRRSSLAIFGPLDDQDRGRLGEELDQRFSPLVHRRLAISEIYLGLFVSDRSLDSMAPDGSNARWAFVKFDRQLCLAHTGTPLDEVIAAIESGAAAGSPDPVQDIVRSVLLSRRAKGRFADALSLGLKGPTLNVGKLLDAAPKNIGVMTNIYD